MIKVILVEDNFYLQKALEEKLSNFPDIFIKDSVQNGEEAIAILERNDIVDVILMDIEMPLMNGIKATQIIKSKYPQIKILMITVFDNDDSVFNAIKAGADGYLLKETKAEKIYEGIQDILAGGAAMSPAIAMKTLKLLKDQIILESYNETESVQLSPREIEVLEQLSKGLKNKDIAGNLFLSAFTVKKHIENIYRKLQAHNRIEMLQKAKQKKIL
ncbi:MAG TPA: response regulator transcription factor [Mariniflexile sp.]|nr:response regulator transcription factor [Mariniflexile sp.]